MQGILVYIYNITLLILFMQSAEVCLYAWKKTGAERIRDLKWIFLLLLGECVVTFAFDMGLIQSDFHGMEGLYLWVRVAVEACLCLLLLRMATHLTENCPIVIYILFAICLGLALAPLFFPVPKTFSSATLSVLYIPMFALAFYLCHHSLQGEQRPLARWRWLLLVSAMSFAAVFFWQVCVFFLHKSGWIYLRYRINWPLDVYWLLLCVCVRRITGEETKRADSRMIAEALQKVAGEERTKPVSEDEAVTAERFCRRYGLTGRESEITELILKGKGNQEIAETLFISVGTVKHHVHNIFVKLEIERRSQLMRAFIDFREEE